MRQLDLGRHFLDPRGELGERSLGEVGPARSPAAGADREPDVELGVMPPRNGIVSVEAIAVNAVMAGCRPEHLPVVLTAVEAALVPDFNLFAVQSTTHPCSPLIIVNGPVAAELGVNSRYGAFGPGHRANATIGRAVRLCLLNIGGAAPGVLDRSTQGQPSKYSFCIAENEAESPWEPLHVERGFEPGHSTVTVVGCENPHNINDHVSTDAEVAYVEAQFRDSDKVWKNTLGCYPVDDPSREDGATMSCSVDCDGGVFFLTERENGSVLIRTHGFAVGAGCGDEEDQTRSVADLNQGTKQTVFRLDPLELADCPKWVE